MARTLLLSLLCLGLACGAAGQLSAPIASDAHFDEAAASGNKFLARRADNDRDADAAFEEFGGAPGGGESLCPLDIELKWMTEVSSSVYATPLITDLFADGRKDVIVPGFVHYTDVLEGPDGAKALGWPGFHKSTVHASPLLYDIDLDGIRDVLVATYDGEIVFFKDNGEQLFDRLYVPRLRVKRDWFVGLNPDPVDHSHPDVGAGMAPEANPFFQALGKGKLKPATATPDPVSPSPSPSPSHVVRQQPAAAPAASPAPQAQSSPSPAQATATQPPSPQPQPSPSPAQAPAQLPPPSPPMGGAAQARRRMLAAMRAAHQLQLQQQGDPGSSLLEPFSALSRGGSGAGDRSGASAGRRRLAQAAAQQGHQAAGVEPDPAHSGLTQEALDSFGLFADADAPGPADGQAAGGQQQPEQQEAVEGGEQQDQEQQQQQQQQQEQQEQQQFEYDEFGDRWPPGYDASYDPTKEHGGAGEHLGGWDHYGDAHDWDSWDDDMFTQSAHAADSSHVYLDAHILATPAIADIDADGHDELVVAVSYFYDKEYYDHPDHAAELRGIDKEKYVAGGIVAFDLRTKVLKWQQHLDLTTATTKFTAHMFASPTLVDLDSDGLLEVVVGTSVGFVYVLDHKGSTRPGWPIQMGEVQGQVLVADLNADGALEIFAGDALGNVALLDANGKELWERHVGSMIGQGAVAGDIDGDGLLEVVFGCADGAVHALRGRDGAPLRGFPFRTGGRVQAPATISQLAPRSGSQHVLVSSFDGFLYAIDGASGCAHAVDIGESAYAAVLVDDLSGDGLLELLLATMNGNVYMLQTQAPYHPLKAWPSQVQGVNGLVARWGYCGFAATQDSRRLRDVAGQELHVQVEVTDRRTLLQHGRAVPSPPRGPYNITAVLKGVGVADMNQGAQPVIGVSDVLAQPGRVTLVLPTPRSRTTAAVALDLVTPDGLHYQDEFVVSFHLHFHKLLKWLIALPALAMAAVLLAVAQAAGDGDAGPRSKAYHLG